MLISAVLQLFFINSLTCILYASLKKTAFSDKTASCYISLAKLSILLFVIHSVNNKAFVCVFGVLQFFGSINNYISR